MQIKSEPGPYSMEISHFRGLSQGPLTILPPHVSVRCRDCGWEKDFPMRPGQRSKRLDVRHACLPCGCTPECVHDGGSCQTCSECTIRERPSGVMPCGCAVSTCGVSHDRPSGSRLLCTTCDICQGLGQE